MVYTSYTREMNFWRVAIKPGKPFAFRQVHAATNDEKRQTSCFYFGLPGNPVSAMITLDQLTAPILKILQGELANTPITLTAIADTPFKKRPGRTDYQRAYFESDSRGLLKVRSSGKQGSGVMTSFLKANCYAVIEQDRDSVSPGEKVTIQVFDKVLS